MGHPVRKGIIEHLDKAGEAGFKELKQSLGVTVGTLYYHLEILGDLVTQNPQRKYMLTEKGKSAKKLLEKGAELQSTGALSPSIGEGLRGFLKGFFFAPRLFKTLSEKPLLFIPGAILIPILGAFLFEQAKMEPRLLLYTAQPILRSFNYILAEVLVAWFGLFVLAELITYLLYKRSGGDLALLVGVPFSLLPSFLLPLAIALSGNLGLTAATFTLVFLLLQAWSFLLLIALTALVKGLPVEKSAVVTLIIVFINLALFTVYL